MNYDPELYSPVEIQQEELLRKIYKSEYLPKFQNSDKTPLPYNTWKWENRFVNSVYFVKNRKK